MRSHLIFKSAAIMFLVSLAIVTSFTVGIGGHRAFAKPAGSACSAPLGTGIVAIAEAICVGQGQAINGWPGNKTVPYVSNGGHNSTPGPNAGSGSCTKGQICGVDCSGFTRWVYYLAYHKTDVLSRGGTTTQIQLLTRVSDSSAIPGDLVFFGSSTAKPSHVGIYIGNGQMIHSPSSGKNVQQETIAYIGQPILGYYRYIPRMTHISGEFLSNPNNSGVFDATQPVVFTQTFQAINFDPSSYPQNCMPNTGVNDLTRPFTDVYPPTNPNGGPCQNVIAQNSGGTELAGSNGLYEFQAGFTASITVPSAGTMTSTITADDGFIFSVGLHNGQQPTAGPNNPRYGAPNVSPLKGYKVIAANNQPAAPVSFTVVTIFPAAGTYPVELDYTECDGGALELVISNSFMP